MKKEKSIQQILKDRDIEECRALFQFNKDTPINEIVLKFNLWVRFFFPQYFKHKDAPFHKEIDESNVRIYIGDLKYFTDIAFRGSAKTTRTKLFLAFVMANDEFHYRKYIKILSKDLSNAKQVTTDIYNMYVEKEVKRFYPELLAKSELKREETMGGTTLDTGVKFLAGTVGVDQRGKLQEVARPDLIWFDDFETSTSLMSAVITHGLAIKMEEARTSLEKDGSCIYTCNYISERGNVHKLVNKKGANRKTMIIPIIKDGKSTWDLYSVEDIKQIQNDTEDFEGEYLCNPSAGADVFVDRVMVDKQEKKEPIKEIANFKMFYEFDASHRYGAGHDIAGGVGLDSSTSVFIDFGTLPFRVVATYKNNEIVPMNFGDEIKRQAEYFGNCLVAPEQNNHGHATIGRLMQIYPLHKIFEKKLKETQIMEGKPREFGWNTNPITKSKMLNDLKKAVEDGLLELSDPDLIAEVRSYSRGDLMDAEIDPRLATRHFDLLIACAIALQMKDYAQVEKEVVEDFDMYDENYV